MTAPTALMQIKESLIYKAHQGVVSPAINFASILGQSRKCSDAGYWRRLFSLRHRPSWLAVLSWAPSKLPRKIVSRYRKTEHQVKRRSCKNITTLGRIHLFSLTSTRPKASTALLAMPIRTIRSPSKPTPACAAITPKRFPQRLKRWRLRIRTIHRTTDNRPIAISAIISMRSRRTIALNAISTILTCHDALCSKRASIRH
jgi:hypothetical protein